MPALPGAAGAGTSLGVAGASGTPSPAVGTQPARTSELRNESTRFLNWVRRVLSNDFAQCSLA